ncbi:MAG: hypothetical protein COA99_19570 [Moraxellaceae bacterium]|nr:MAG: hypothetical protein COA99_19570 [Moraxellaceae bacterium]
MDKKYGVFKTGKGCLTAIIGMLTFMIVVLYLAIIVRPEKPIVVMIMIFLASILVWISFKVDNRRNQ